MRHSTKKPTLKVKKQSIRRLGERELSQEELGQVVGGYLVAPRYTQNCGCFGR